MPLYGYARVSTLDQDLTIQHTALKAAGCEVIRAEKASGTRRDGRSELQALLDFVRAGDTLVVTRIDRLARSLKDLQDIVHELKARGVALKATEQPVDTGTASGKAFLDMLGVFAEFETNLRRERRCCTDPAGGAAGRAGVAGRPLTCPRMPSMPFKLNQDRRQHIPRQKRKVTNWREYDAGLRQRGSLTVWFTDEAVQGWQAEPRATRGGQPDYSPLA